MTISRKNMKLLEMVGIDGKWMKMAANGLKCSELAGLSSKLLSMDGMY